MFNPFSQYATAAKLIGLALLIALLYGCGYKAGTHAGDGRAAKAETALANYQRDVAQERELAEASARQVEQDRMTALADAAKANEDRIREIELETGKRVTDLQSGNVRLRREVAAYATASLSRDTAAAVQSDAAASRGAELVGAAIAVGAACDARQQALIQAYEANR